MSIVYVDNVYTRPITLIKKYSWCVYTYFDNVHIYTYLSYLSIQTQSKNTWFPPTLGLMSLRQVTKAPRKSMRFMAMSRLSKDTPCTWGFFWMPNAPSGLGQIKGFSENGSFLNIRILNLCICIYIYTYYKTMYVYIYIYLYIYM